MRLLAMVKQEDEGPTQVLIYTLYQQAFEVFLLFQSNLFLLVFASTAFSCTDVYSEDLF